MFVTRLFLFLALAANCALAEEHHHNHLENMPSTPDNSMATQLLVPTPHVDHHHHGLPILRTNLLPEERLFWENYNSTVSYFRTPSNHSKSLYAHVLIGLFTIVFVYPVSLVLKNLNVASWYLASLLVHSTLIFTSLLTYSIFINSIPQLYPDNAYNKMSWILLFSTISQLVAALIKYAYGYNNLEYCKLNSDDEHALGLEGSSSPSSTLFEFSRSNTSSMEMPAAEENEYKTSTNSMLPRKDPGSVIGHLLGLPVFNHVSSSIYHISNAVFNFLNWGHFFFYLAYVPTGLATFLILGQGNSVFNLLAHFIKGGVFFAYGILTLARYSGAFKNKGWAWNHHFITTFTKNNSRWNRVLSKGLITMEFVESSLILFYGCTNIFLEHLSDAGGEWSPKDLQHASIAFIFIGCGLCGVITELKLSTWRHERSVDNFKAFQGEDSPSDKADTIVKSSPGFSPNPFPVVTIFWTGILMSKHQQASETSTEIHVQWGNMFILGCAFRLLTYTMVLMSPPNKLLTGPARPFTELIVSFGLLCGGLIFMESTDPIVLIFEYYGFTSMFTLNVSLGFVALFMGWEMAIFAFKDWLSARKAK